MSQASDTAAAVLDCITCSESDHRIIFLDVDGVIANTQTLLERAKQWKDKTLVDLTNQFVPTSVKVLKEIVDIMDAKVVISSSWRKLPETLGPLLCKMVNNGIPVIGVTPSVPSGRRDEEIFKYMRDNKLRFGDVLVLDDDSADLTDVETRLYKVNPKYGLRQTDLPGIFATFCGKHIKKSIDRKTLIDMIKKLSSCDKLTASRNLRIPGASDNITTARCIALALCHYVSTSRDSRDSSNCHVALSSKYWTTLTTLYGFES